MASSLMGGRLDVRRLSGELHEMLHADFCGQEIVMNTAQSP